MGSDDTKRQIQRAVEHADEPALSAKQIAERTGLAVKTVNNHIGPLTESGDLAATQIGNATAYYSNRVRGGSHGDHSHECRRCGRAVTQSRDMARLDLYEFFGEEVGVSTHAFYLLCRFCKDDLDAWLFGDENRGYPFVHRWNIPTEQLRDVQQDEAVVTSPGPELALMDASLKQLYDIIREQEQAADNGWADETPVHFEYAEQQGIDTGEWGPEDRVRVSRLVNESIRDLIHRGWLEKGPNGYRTARDASVDGHPEPRAN